MSQLLKNMIETDFTIIKEDWNRFLVEDGTVMRVRIIVSKILHTVDKDPMGYPNFTIASNNLVTALVPPRLIKEPSKEPWNPKKDVGQEMKFEVIQENTQEYHTTNGFKVLVKPFVSKIFRYLKYNNFGEPIYNVPSIQPILNIEKLKRD